MAEKKRAPSVTGGALLVVAASRYRARPGDDPPEAVVVVVVEKAERSASMERRWQSASRLSIAGSGPGGRFPDWRESTAKALSGTARIPPRRRQIIEITWFAQEIP